MSNGAKGSCERERNYWRHVRDCATCLLEVAEELFEVGRVRLGEAMRRRAEFVADSEAKRP